MEEKISFKVKPEQPNPAADMATMAVELLTTYSYLDLENIFKKGYFRCLYGGNAYFVMVEKNSHTVIQQFEINFPQDDKSVIFCRISDLDFHIGINDENFANQFSLPQYNLISYGLSYDWENIAGMFFFSKPEDELSYIKNLMAVMAPHLHTALNNIHFFAHVQKKEHVKLSKREIEVLYWISRGKTNQEIGIILGISCFTIKNHIANIFDKMEVVNRAQATEKAFEIGYLH